MKAILEEWRRDRAARRRIAALGLGDCPGRPVALASGSEVSVYRFAGPDGPAVAKLAWTPEAQKRLAQEADLYPQADGTGDGSEGPPRPMRLRAPGEDGVLVLEHIDAPNLCACLDAAPDARARTFARAAGWLAAYTRGRRTQDTFGGGLWLRARGAQIGRMRKGPAREAAEALHSGMEATRARVGQPSLTRARSHGNLTPRNLLIEPHRVWGVGLESGPWIAIIRDIARLAVLCALDDPKGSQNPVIDPYLIAAFPAAGLVGEREIERLLPFFVASELCAVLARPGSKTRSSRAIALAATLTDPQAGIN